MEQWLVPNWERSTSRLYILRLKVRLDEEQDGMKISRKNINKFRNADNTMLKAESIKKLKTILMRVKEDSEKANLNQHPKNQGHGIRSNHVMANRGGNNGNSERLYFPGLQHHSRCWLQPWSKTHLLHGTKAMTDPESILKSRDITLLPEVRMSKRRLFQ